MNVSLASNTNWLKDAALEEENTSSHSSKHSSKSSEHSKKSSRSSRLSSRGSSKKRAEKGAMKGDHSFQSSLMSLNEDNQHHERKPPVIDVQNNRITQHVKHSSRKYQRDNHTEQILARWSVNDDINKNGYQQLERNKNNSSRSTDDINKMCNLLLYQPALMWI